MKSLPANCLGAKKEILYECDPKHPFQIMIEMNGYSSIVEVGVFAASLASRILHDLKDKISIYYMVDPYKPYPESYDREPRAEELTQEYWDKYLQRAIGLTQRCPNKAFLIREESVIAARQLIGETVDIVYLDGIHDRPNLINDVYCWLQLICDGGMIGGHDYAARFGSYVETIDAIFGDGFNLYSGHNWFVPVTSESRKRYLSIIIDQYRSSLFEGVLSI